MSYLYRVLNDTDAIGAQHFDPALVTTQKESNKPTKKQCKEKEVKFELKMVHKIQG